jgi:hypothetical protein
VRPRSPNPLYRAWLPRPVHAERALFPGAVTIALAIAGAWPPLTASRTALIVSGAVAFDGSLGLNGVFYPALYKLLPPLRSVRVPARFAIMVVLTLAMLAGYGTARLLSRLKGSRAQILVLACVTAAIIADAWPQSDRLPVWRSPPSIYAVLPTSGSVLFEFPVHSPADRLSENLPYMYFSIWHWRPMVNGYSGFVPQSYYDLSSEIRDFPNPIAIAALQRHGVTHVSMICALGDAGCGGVMDRMRASTHLRLIAAERWHDGPVQLYEVLN